MIYMDDLLFPVGYMDNLAHDVFVWWLGLYSSRVEFGVAGLDSNT
jgi:hypothetical protein